MTQINSLVELAQAIEGGKQIQQTMTQAPYWSAIDFVGGGDSIRFAMEMIATSSLRIKPSLKKIDLSCLVGSGVLCEFGPNQDTVGYLMSINGSSHNRNCGPNSFESFEYCRPLFNHWHHHTGGECPIPDGFVVEVRFISDDEITQDENVDSYTRSAQNGMWKHTADYKIIAYRITGTAEGWEL
jgi:hypothetical protein